MFNNQVKIKVNGEELLVREGLTLLEAIRELGKYRLVRYCYDGRLGVSGNCRACLVELKGINKSSSGLC